MQPLVLLSLCRSTTTVCTLVLLSLGRSTTTVCTLVSLSLCRSTTSVRTLVPLSLCRSTTSVSPLALPLGRSNESAALPLGRSTTPARKNLRSPAPSVTCSSKRRKRHEYWVLACHRYAASANNTALLVPLWTAPLRLWTAPKIGQSQRWRRPPRSQELPFFAIAFALFFAKTKKTFLKHRRIWSRGLN